MCFFAGDDARADFGGFVGDGVVKRTIEFVQPVFGRGDRVGPALGQALGECLRGSGDLAFGDEMSCESAAKSLITRHCSAGKQHRSRRSRADLFHEPWSDDRGTDAEIDFGIAEFCFRMSDCEIAHNHEPATTADRRALDARDGRDRKSANRAGNMGKFAQHLSHRNGIVGNGAQIHACAK